MLIAHLDTVVKDTATASKDKGGGTIMRTTSLKSIYEQIFDLWEKLEEWRIGELSGIF